MLRYGTSVSYPPSMGMNREHSDVLKWTLTEAAQQCSVSRSTIRRYREQGKLPNAEKTSDRGWIVPVTDLIAAGLTPGRPSPAQDVLTSQAQPAHPEPAQVAHEVEELRTQLRIERIKREAAEQLAAERSEALADMRIALRLIEPPSNAPLTPTNSQQPPDTASPNGSSEQTPEAVTRVTPSFWTRLFGRTQP